MAFSITNPERVATTLLRKMCWKKKTRIKTEHSCMQKIKTKQQQQITKTKQNKNKIRTKLEPKTLLSSNAKSVK